MSNNSLFFNMVPFTNAFIQARLPEHKRKIYKWNFITLMLHVKEKHIELSYDSISGIIPVFREFLQAYVAKQLEITLGDKEDIGFLYNHYLRLNDIYYNWRDQNQLENDLSFEEFLDENLCHDQYAERVRAIGDFYKYNVWESTQKRTISWLYEKQDMLYLHVTPYFYWDYERENDVIKLRTEFEAFMKNYQPLFLTEIPNKVVKRWLKQTEDILALLEEHHQRLQKKK